MGLFNWLSPKKKRENDVVGTLEYIPGSHSFAKDETIVLEEGQLKRRMFIQPANDIERTHSDIPIYTGNPFRELKKV